MREPGLVDLDLAEDRDHRHEQARVLEDLERSQAAAARPLVRRQRRLDVRGRRAVVVAESGVEEGAHADHRGTRRLVRSDPRPTVAAPP